VREGATLWFLAAEGAEDFRQLHQAELGRDDLAYVRFEVIDSGEPGIPVDARLVELKVRTSKLVPDATADPGDRTSDKENHADHS